MLDFDEILLLIRNAETEEDAAKAIYEELQRVAWEQPRDEVF